MDFAALRRREFSRLDATGNAYLDYTGTALYPESLVRRDGRRLLRGVFGNPHSESAPSLASTEALEEARRLTLRFFDADPREYDLVFTANASGSNPGPGRGLSLSRRLAAGGHGRQPQLGERPAPARRGAPAPTVEYVPLDGCLRGRDPRLWLPLTTAPSLFAFPAQSNFSGVRHPLAWVQDAQARGYHVLLDAAAYAPTRALSLAQVPADFVAISFYKMFGYPSGVGALLVRRQALAALERRYFAGGTVQIVSVQNDVVRVRGRQRRVRGRHAELPGDARGVRRPAVADGRRHGGNRPARAVDDGGTAGPARHAARPRPRLRAHRPHRPRRRGGLQPRTPTVACSTTRWWKPRRGHAAWRFGAGASAIPAPPSMRSGCPRHRRPPASMSEFSVARLRSCLDGLPVGALRASIGPPTTSADLDRLLALAHELTAGG